MCNLCGIESGNFVTDGDSVTVCRNVEACEQRVRDQETDELYAAAYEDAAFDIEWSRIPDAETLRLAYLMHE